MGRTTVELDDELEKERQDMIGIRTRRTRFDYALRELRRRERLVRRRIDRNHLGEQGFGGGVLAVRPRAFEVSPYLSRGDKRRFPAAQGTLP